MDEREDDRERYRDLPEPVRISQSWITYSAVPAPLLVFGDGCAPFGGGCGDGD